MQISMYQASVPVFIHMLANLVTILEKAAAHAEARKIDPTVLVTARLFPDMFPLSRQVQIAADMAKAGPCAPRRTAAALVRGHREDISRTDRARAKDGSLPRDAEARADRRCRGTQRDLADARYDTHAAGGVQYLLNHVTMPERLLPHHDDVQHPASQRCRNSASRISWVRSPSDQRRARRVPASRRLQQSRQRVRIHQPAGTVQCRQDHLRRMLATQPRDDSLVPAR